MGPPGRRHSNDYVDIIQNLPFKLRLSYGVGHVLNDICASMWFTYLLVYFHLVLQFSSSLSGIILLVGQIADALSTVFVGVQSDKTDNFFLCRYGRRKTWHLIGVFCILFSFPFIFSPCLGCQNSHHEAQLVYYSAFVIIFQFGWASLQISHLSLIPDLTPSEHERTGLIAIRYSFTVCSNVLVYLITWGVLHVTSDSKDAQIGPGDITKFQHIVWIGLSVGTICSLAFHLFVKESPSYETEHVDSFSSHRIKKTMSMLLRDLRLYQVAALYMATRLFCNLSQVYVPLYLHESLSMPAESLAILPLVMFLASFVMSLLLKFMNKKCGRQITYVVGAILGVAACIWIYFGKDEIYNVYEIYAVAALLGAGGSVMLVTSLGVTADLIGPNTETGAFVYGTMSFTDKLANGLAVVIIQDLKCRTSCPNYYKDILSFVCGGSAVLGFLTLLTIVPFERALAQEQSPYAEIDEQNIVRQRIDDGSIQRGASI